MFIPKATSVIEMGQGDLYFDRIVKENIHAFMGSVFEEMCRYFTLENGIQGVYGGFTTKVGNWWGMESIQMPSGKQQQPADIDVVAVSDIDKSAVVGECKFKNEKIDKIVYETLVRRTAVISGKYRVSKLLFFSLSGYTDWFKEISDDGTMLYTLEDMYQ